MAINEYQSSHSGLFVPYKYKHIGAEFYHLLKGTRTKSENLKEILKSFAVMVVQILYSLSSSTTASPWQAGEHCPL